MAKITDSKWAVRLTPPTFCVRSGVSGGAMIVLNDPQVTRCIKAEGQLIEGRGYIVKAITVHRCHTEFHLANHSRAYSSVCFDLPIDNFISHKEVIHILLRQMGIRP